MTNRPTNKFFPWILVAALIAGANQPAGATEKKPQAAFTEERSFAGKNLELQGTGLKRVFFMRAFMAGLYFEEGQIPEDPLADVAKQIEVHYFVNIPGDKLSKFTIDTMIDNIGKEAYSRIEDRIDDMRQYFVDLKPGDNYTLAYIPLQGTYFIYNGNVVGVIQGKDFAEALFSTWLGARPFDAKLKEEILGDMTMTRNKPDVKVFFNELNKDTMHLVDRFYDRDAYFQDPLGVHEGRDAIKAYYLRLYENVKEIRFDYGQDVSEGSNQMVTWKMHLISKLNKGKTVTVDGVTVLEFGGKDNKVVYHRDYFDMGEFIYKDIPVLNTLIKFVNDKLKGA